MSRLRETAIKVAIIVLGLTEVLHAQEDAGTGGPQFCPPLDELLTPTLLDVFIYPGLSTG